MNENPQFYWAEPIEVEVDQLDLVNMGQYNIQDSKTRLSELLALAAAGEDVVIAKAGKPVARIVPITPPTKRELGFLKMDIPDERLLESWTTEEMGFGDERIPL